jgi:hypothetical protein
VSLLQQAQQVLLAIHPWRNLWVCIEMANVKTQGFAVEDVQSCVHEPPG